ncbi:hypothetical protein Ancab_033123 [Ancistrocladus abbreviatus]
MTMKLSKAIVSSSQLTPAIITLKASNFHRIPTKRLHDFRTSHGFNLSGPLKFLSSGHLSPLSAIPSGVGPSVFEEQSGQLQNAEESIEKAIYGCRFLTLFGIMGSLIGSILCFVKGCTVVASSFIEYFGGGGNVTLFLAEATDIYLLGTVMLVFGMGLYELFVSNLDIAKSALEEKYSYGSNLFGLFTLMERPKWLEIKSVNELKTKVGRVIVMLLLIGLLDKSKKAAIQSTADLLCFSASILLSSVCLYLLAKLNDA